MKTSDFAEFFRTINGFDPFAWQQRLVDHIVEHGAWPEQIAAPTGSGKSSIVDVHVFVNALYALGVGPRVPRRLVTAVNRRALVDDLEARARHLQVLLADAPAGVVDEVADALTTLVRRPNVAAPEGDVDGTPLTVVNLRGGIRPDAEWLVDPRGCSVIAATPDMAGSRLLFRGYGSSRMARPREAGLLAYDSVIALDEAHLNVQFLKTARVVGRELATTQAFSVPSLQVVAVSATQMSAGQSVGVLPADLDVSETLRDRLTRPKRLTIHETAAWPMRKPTVAYIKELADLAEKMRESVSGTVGCIVNNVAVANQLAIELRKRVPDRLVVSWVGRMRPMDLAAQRSVHPGLFTTEGDPGVAFLVATQTVEVGVDIDLHGLVTELASASAIAQRCGRVNRIGSRPDAEVIVVAPPTVSEGRLPYLQSELSEAVAWLQTLGSDDYDIAPWTVMQHPVPPARPRRLVFSTLRSSDWNLLADTSGPLFSEPDLAFWLRDDLEVEEDPVSVVIRNSLPRDDAQALGMLKATEFVAEEAFPASAADVTRLLQTRVFSDESVTARAFLRTADAWELLLEAPRWVSPGTTVVVDSGHAITQNLVVSVDGAADEKPTVLWGDNFNPASIPAFGTGWVLLRERTPPGSVVGDALLGAADIEGEEISSSLVAALGLSNEWEAITSPIEQGEPPEWVVVRPRSTTIADAELRQELSPERMPVSLQEHETAVARLAARLATDLGLPDDLIGCLGTAGLLHDRGKCHPGFQVKLGADRDGPLLAKSGASTKQELARLARATPLPPKWRHEQLSVVYAAEHADLTSDPDLVMRLVGTSHGRGRPFFPHAMSLLSPDHPKATDAQRLFAGTGWSEILERTETTYGVWGCAYLEAVLRSADTCVSGDGS